MKWRYCWFNSTWKANFLEIHDGDAASVLENNKYADWYIIYLIHRSIIHCYLCSAADVMEDGVWWVNRIIIPHYMQLVHKTAMVNGLDEFPMITTGPATTSEPPRQSHGSSNCISVDIRHYYHTRAYSSTPDISWSAPFDTATWSQRTLKRSSPPGLWGC